MEVPMAAPLTLARRVNANRRIQHQSPYLAGLRVHQMPYDAALQVAATNVSGHKYKVGQLVD
jgi:hypothetical protein